MVFMDYRDFEKEKVQPLGEEYPTFLYVMPLSSTRVFYEVSWHCDCTLIAFHYATICQSAEEAYLSQETCLASRNAMPFNLLKEKLMSRLAAMGIRVKKIYEEVSYWSNI